MVWVKFAKDFDFSPAARKGWVTLAYRAGAIENVTRECADQAIAAGSAKRTTRPGGKNADHEGGPAQSQAGGDAESGERRGP